MKKLVGIVTSVLLLSSCTNYKISGYVHDFDSDKPLNNVEIDINGYKTKTDTTGYFSISINSNSSSIIHLKKEDYANKEVTRKPDSEENKSTKSQKNMIIYLFKNESDFYYKNR